MPAWLGSGEDSLPGWLTTTFSLCPHMAESEPAQVFSFLNIYLFIIYLFWLRRVSVAACGLLVVACGLLVVAYMQDLVP